MAIARIIQQDRKTTSSGRGKTGKWTLEFESSRAQRNDPLTGWVGNADTRAQVRLGFDTKEAAIAYCERQGWEYQLVAAPPVRLKLQAYADNFR